MSTMSERAAEMAKAAVQANIETSTTQVVTPIPHDPVFINTMWGAVSVYGHELISKKDLVILSLCLGLPEFTMDLDHKVRCVVFREDGRPKDNNGDQILANCFFDMGGVCINLMRTFSVAVEEAKNIPEVSIRAAYHRQLITSILHEIQHLAFLDYAPKDEESLKNAEADADEWAFGNLAKMVKTIDIEPAHHSESSFLCGQLMELLSENKDEWVSNQQHMLDNNLFYRLPASDGNKEVAVHAFKGYIHLLVDKEDYVDPAWKNQTITDSNAGSPIYDAIRSVDNTVLNQPKSQAVQDAEDMELEDPGIEGMSFDPNMMGFGSMGFAANPAVGAGPANASFESAGNPFPPTSPYAGFPVGGSTLPAQEEATQTQAEVQSLPLTGLTEQQTADVAMGVYMKVYTHIFTHCGRLLNSDIGFQNPEAAAKMAIPLTDIEKAVVMKMDCLDPNGRFCPAISTAETGILGLITKNTRIPMYKLYLNVNGVERIRICLPQNTAKRDGRGNYSKPAQAARGGSCIMYLKEGCDAVIAAGGKEWLFKIIDGQIITGY